MTMVKSVSEKGDERLSCKECTANVFDKNTAHAMPRHATPRMHARTHTHTLTDNCMPHQVELLNDFSSSWPDAPV